MIINWIIGKQNWAYKNLTSHLIRMMPRHKHLINDKDNKEEVRFLVSMDQLKTEQVTSDTILHMDGNRWYTQTNKKED